MVIMDTKPHINFKDEGVTTTFYEGDSVICCIGSEERYEGKIIGIGNWKESDESESCEVICIDTSKNSRSYSSEIIKIEDITYICKNPLAEESNTVMSKDEMNKKTYCGMLIGLGYDKDKVENLWDKAKKTMKIYDIPVTKMTACTVYSLKNNCNINVPLKMICGIDIEEIEHDINDLEKCVSKKIAKVVLGLGMLGVALDEVLND